MAHLREDMWGIYVIAKREFYANLMSIRTGIMVAILALMMIGGAIGFTQPSGDQQRDEGYLYHLVAADPDGRLDDLVVYVYFADTYEPIPGRGVNIAIENLTFPQLGGKTGPDGTFMAKDLTPAFHILQVDLKNDGGGGFTTGMGVTYTQDLLPNYVFVPHNVTLPFPMLSVVVQEDDTSGNDRLDDVVAQVLSPDGSPLEGATVAVGGTSGTTNVNGVAFVEGVGKGEHNVTASAQGGLVGAAKVSVSDKTTQVNPFSGADQGPDQVLFIIAILAMGMFGPIYAIVLCFDSVFREKLSGSIDYLLTRPMGRRAVILGKFTGILAALMLPIAIVSLVGVAAISWKSGQSPSGGVLVGYLFYTTVLIAVFALIQMVFSTVAKTTGTAVLSGVGIWLVFAMLFNIIIYVVAILRDMDFNSQEFTDFATRASMWNPISLYGSAMGVLVDIDIGAGLPNWSAGAILLVTLVVMLVLTTELFRRKATE
jgi:ABC-type transport system involved in multi-copper enzyme maturation permease subunit